MRKKQLVLIAVLAPLIVFVIGIFIMGYLATQPHYEAKYFTQPYLEKHSSPEATFNHLWDAHILGDKEYYQEVLGRELSERESKWTFSKYEKLEIEKVILRGKNSAYILAENNWGGSFEKLNGRWVFQNREIGFYYREFFRVFNVELSKFNDYTIADGMKNAKLLTHPTR